MSTERRKAPVTDTSPGPGNNQPKIDTTVAHSARVWNYWLGGKDNYPVDREAGDYVMSVFPDIVRIARADRAFLARAVNYLVGEEGIRQFLDIGTGLPTANNTHQVAQAMAPESRVVYVDNDPLVLVHARALLTSTAEGACDYVESDVRDPDKILAGAAKTLDFSRPVALIMLGILGQVPDSDNPESIVSRLLDAVPSGSYLVAADGVNTSQKMNEATARYNENMAYPYKLRSPEQIKGFFAGLKLVEPGVVSVPLWRPEATRFGDPDEVPAMCGVGRKP
jgi:O-methyltransferase involved in polyketide biosynthesis